MSALSNAAVLLLGSLAVLHGQGTAFTYQGSLSKNGSPAAGIYDLAFSLYDSLGGSNQIGSSITNFQVPVSNGVFSTMIDFGSVFDGGDRWLEIGVQTNGGSAFAALSPRQAITPAPYAITSLRLSGTGMGEVLAISQSNIQAQVNISVNAVVSSNAQSALTSQTNIAVNAVASALATASPGQQFTVSITPDDVSAFAGMTRYSPPALWSNGVIRVEASAGAIYTAFGFIPSLVGAQTSLGNLSGRVLHAFFRFHGSRFGLGTQLPNSCRFRVNDSAWYYPSVSITGYMANTLVSMGTTNFYQVEFESGPGSAWCYLYLDVGAGLEPPPAARKKLIILGDSFVDGARGVNGYQLFPMLLEDHFTDIDVWPCGIGSTGLINPGTNNSPLKTNYIGRVFGDVIPNAPDAVLIWGSVNDGGYSASNMFACATNLITVIKTNLPSCKIMMNGIISGATPAISTCDPANAGISNACVATGASYIYPNGPVPWFNGTYNSAGSGNAVYYYGNDPNTPGAQDGCHPNAEGHKYIAECLVPFVKSNMSATLRNGKW